MTESEEKQFTDIRARAFKIIQNDPGLYKEWNCAKMQSDRELLMTKIIYEMGHDVGYENGYVSRSS